MRSRLRRWTRGVSIPSLPDVHPRRQPVRHYHLMLPVRAEFHALCELGPHELGATRGGGWGRPTGAPSTSAVIRSELPYRSSRTRDSLGASLRSDPSHPTASRLRFLWRLSFHELTLMATCGRGFAADTKRQHTITPRYPPPPPTRSAPSSDAASACSA